MSMSLLIAIGVAAVLAGIIVFRAVPFMEAYFEFRGKRLISCPETQQTAAVSVAAGRAAATALLGEPTLRLKQCSRWPERQNCGQECLAQIEADPDNCLVWNIVSNWYEGQECAVCHKHFGRLHHLDHPPALMDPEKKTRAWDEISPERLPEIFSTCQPVCWNCHVVETFRRTHPELIVDRHRDTRNAA